MKEITLADLRELKAAALTVIKADDDVADEVPSPLNADYKEALKRSFEAEAHYHSLASPEIVIKLIDWVLPESANAPSTPEGTDDA